MVVWGCAKHAPTLGLGYKTGSGPPHTSDSLCHFDVPRNTTVLNSKVISVTVKPPPRSLLTPLEIEFAHMYNVSAAHVCGCPGTLVRSECIPVHSSQAVAFGVTSRVTLVWIPSEETESLSSQDHIADWCGC